MCVFSPSLLIHIRLHSLFAVSVHLATTTFVQYCCNSFHFFSVEFFLSVSGNFRSKVLVSQRDLPHTRAHPTNGYMTRWYAFVGRLSHLSHLSLLKCNAKKWTEEKCTINRRNQMGINAVTTFATISYFILYICLLCWRERDWPRVPQSRTVSCKFWLVLML